MSGTFSTCLGGFNGILTFPMRTTLSKKIRNHYLEFLFFVSSDNTIISNKERLNEQVNKTTTATKLQQNYAS